MKIVLLAFGLVLLGACESAPKNATDASSPEQHSTKEKKTSFGKAVQKARDLDDASNARNEEMGKQVRDATE